jgi:hypothetical protein
MSQADASKAGRDLASTLLSETRAELVRADSKAQILLATTGVAVGVVLAALIKGEWSPSQLSGLGLWLWWIGVAALVGGVIALGFAVFPRHVGTKHRERVTYFGDVARFNEAQERELLAALQRESERANRATEQLLRLSKVVQQKYQAIQLAIWFLGLAILLCSVGPIVG